MSFDDQMANRQADAHSFFLGCNERLEEPAYDLRWQTRPRIRYNKFYEILVHARRHNREFAPRDALHRFYAISYEVDQHLSHLNFVDQNWWDSRIALLVNLDY